MPGRIIDSLKSVPRERHPAVGQAGGRVPAVKVRRTETSDKLEAIGRGYSHGRPSCVGRPWERLTQWSRWDRFGPLFLKVCPRSMLRATVLLRSVPHGNL